MNYENEGQAPQGSQPDRLSGMGSTLNKQQSEHWTKASERNSKKFLRLSRGHLSNRMDATIDFYAQYLVVNEQITLQNQDPVLNELADRLGVSLKQTEDQLIRDMLQATASFINCVSGGNGGIAVVKSDLIDFKSAA